MQGSVGVPIIMTVLDCDGNVIPLGDAINPVVLKMKPGRGPTITRNALVHDAPNGIIRYVTVADDFPTHGEWKAQLIVSFSGGRVIPSKRFIIQVDESN